MYRARISHGHEILPGERGAEPVPFERGTERASVSVCPDGSRTLTLAELLPVRSVTLRS